MTFLRLAFFPGVTKEQWAAVVEAVGEVDVPITRRAFAAGPVDGGWQVMQLWDSKEDLDRFNHEVYLPSIARLTDHGFPHRPVVHDITTQDAWIGRQRLA